MTNQVDRLKVDRLKEKTLACAAGAAGRCATTQSQDRLDTLAVDCVMDDHYCPSVFSLQPKHLSSYIESKVVETEKVLNGLIRALRDVL